MKQKGNWILVFLSFFVICGVFAMSRQPVSFRFLMQLAMLVGAFFLVYGLLGIGGSFFPWLRFPVKVVKIVLWVCVGIVFVLFVIVEGFILSGEKTDENIPDVEYLVVLGAGVDGDVPSAMLYERLVAAYGYLESHPDTIAVLCGGQGRGEWITEAEAMYRWLSEKGIDESRLLKEETSTDTEENIENAKKIMSDRGYAGKELAVVTTDFHLFRADLIAEKNGYTAYKISAALPDGFLLWLNYHCREFVSVMLFLIGK